LLFVDAQFVLDRGRKILQIINRSDVLRPQPGRFHFSLEERDRLVPDPIDLVPELPILKTAQVLPAHRLSLRPVKMLGIFSSSHSVISWFKLQSKYYRRN